MLVVKEIVDDEYQHFHYKKPVFSLMSEGKHAMSRGQHSMSDKTCGCQVSVYNFGIVFVDVGEDMWKLPGWQADVGFQVRIFKTLSMMPWCF